MKIEIEKFILLIFLIGMSLGVMLYETPNSDNYLHYYEAKVFLNHPDILLIKDITSENVSTQENIISAQAAGIKYFHYPLGNLLMYTLTTLLNLPNKIWFLIPIFIAGIVTYKMEKRALPFLILSFMFIRTFVFGNNDNWITALSLLSIYFFNKEEYYKSGLVIGFCPLIKGIGFISLGAWVVAFALKEFVKFKDNSINLNFDKRYVLPILIALFIGFIWSARITLVHYLLNNEFNLMTSITGQTSSSLEYAEDFLTSDFQENQPERKFFDNSGYYLLPFDAVLHVFSFLAIYQIIKNKKVEIEEIFIFIYLGIFLVIHVIDFRWLSAWRYYEVIFPLIAIKTSRLFNKKYLPFIFIASLLVFSFYIYYLQNYSLHKILYTLKHNYCPEIKNHVKNDPVYVKSFHSWTVINTCDFNASPENRAMWKVVPEEGIVEKIGE